jgi:hypothetical protein
MGRSNNFMLELSSSEVFEKKDLVDIFKDIGKSVKNVFTGEKNHPKGPTWVIRPTLPHDSISFGMVYANDLAKQEFEKPSPQFLPGAIIVREKNLSINDDIPALVIAMVKRKKGFNKKTGDWEFFTFNGKDLQMQTRETTGDCAKCHIQAEKTDWVFRDYLK